MSFLLYWYHQSSVGIKCYESIDEEEDDDEEECADCSLDDVECDVSGSDCS